MCYLEIQGSMKIFTLTFEILLAVIPPTMTLHLSYPTKTIDIIETVPALKGLLKAVIESVIWIKIFLNKDSNNLQG